MKSAVQILRHVWNSTLLPSAGSSAPPLLSLIDHMYHAPSGLHSEGVWHNLSLILAYLRLQLPERAYLTASSLYALNYDSQHHAWRQRTWSPYWDHQLDNLPRHFKKSHYEENHQHRLGANALSIIVWRALAAEKPEPFAPQWQMLTSSFCDLFYDASLGLWKSATEKVSYRAVDHALAYCALRVMRQHDRNSDKLESLMKATRNTLLTTFGYGQALDNGDWTLVRSYYHHPDRSSSASDAENAQLRFLWQEIWVLLALLDDTPRAQSLMRALIRDYLQPSTNLLTSEPLYRGKTCYHTDLPAYTGDDALFGMTVRWMHKRGIFPADVQSQVDTWQAAYDAAIESENVYRSPDGTLFGSNLFAEKGIWANSEYAFAAAVEPEDFAL
jgi:hypothetical protein